MKILYITQTFPPEPGATARPFYQAKHLQNQGCNVIVLTTMPNYPYGKIYKGYRNIFRKKESIDGLKILRVWSLPAKNSGIFLRMISHLSFALVTCITGLFLRRFDIVIASVPNIGTELSGLIISKVRNSSFVLEQRDLVPDNLQSINIKPNALISRILKKYYTFINRQAKLIIVPYLSMIKCLNRSGIDNGKIVQLPHGYQRVDRNDSIDIKSKLGIEGRFVVLYAGSFSQYYDVLNFIDAASLLDEKYPEIVFLIIGTGPDFTEACRLLEHYQLKNIKLLGAMHPDMIPLYLEKADIFLTSYVLPVTTPEYLHGAILTKTAEYLYAAKPIIAIEDGMNTGNIIQQNDMGTSVPPKQPAALAETILQYYQNPEKRKVQGAKARIYAETFLDRSKNIIPLYNHLKKLLK